MTRKTSFDNEPVYLRGLLRYFVDLRDGTHGNGAVTREDKKALFAAAVDFLDVYVRQALTEMNDTLLLGAGSITATGLTQSPDGDVTATWFLGWPEQEQHHIQPVSLQAFFGCEFHYPHLRGATVDNWPLNVFSEVDAAAELPTLRAIAGADLHNLVLQSDYHIIPAIIENVMGGRK